MTPSSINPPAAARAFPAPLADRSLTIVAWVVTLASSAIVDIAWAEVTGAVPAWMPFARLSLLAGLALVGQLWRPWRPLRNFALLLFAMFGLAELRIRLDFTWLPLQSLFGGTAFDARMQAEQTGKLAVSLIMIALMLALGYRRGGFFLTRGDLRAPITPVPWLGFPKPDPWPNFALQWGFYIAAALAAMMALSLQPDADQLLGALPVLPSVLFYAALNAFNEELTYRSPLLAALEPIGGSRHALWMAAVFFGVAHYFGTPGGLIGAVASIFMGWILGKGMVETRGLFWTWWMHFLSDVAIFFFMAVALGR